MHTRTHTYETRSVYAHVLLSIPGRLYFAIYQGWAATGIYGCSWNAGASKAAVLMNPCAYKCAQAHGLRHMVACFPNTGGLYVHAYVRVHGTQD